ncbi:hypothetical protein ACXYMO_09355 [Arenibacterium sp. CAU 1754]
MVNPLIQLAREPRWLAFGFGLIGLLLKAGFAPFIAFGGQGGWPSLKSLAELNQANPYFVPLALGVFLAAKNRPAAFWLFALAAVYRVDDVIRIFSPSFHYSAGFQFFGYAYRIVDIAAPFAAAVFAAKAFPPFRQAGGHASNPLQLGLFGALLFALVIYWFQPPTLIERVIERGGSTLGNLALLRWTLQPTLVALTLAILAARQRSTAVSWISAVAMLLLLNPMLANINLVGRFGFGAANLGLWSCAVAAAAALALSIQIGQKAQVQS